jgi:prevent-host-death family protein
VAAPARTGKAPSDLYSDHMSKRLTATEAKARLLALLDEAAAGEDVEITKHGRIVARLVPATGAHSLKGSAAGVAVTAAEDDDLFTTGATWNLS